MRTIRIRQGGYGLLEALGALAILGTVSYAYSTLQVNNAIAQLTEEVGKRDAQIQFGVNKYIADNRQALLNGTLIPGFPSPLAPTLVQLQTEVSPGVVPPLPAGYDAPNALGLSYTVALERMPAGCTPGVGCTDIRGLMVSTDSIANMQTGLADGARAGEIAAIIGPDAAYTLEDSGSVLRSIEGTAPWAATPNPRGNAPGTLVVRVGYGSQNYANLDYLLPRDGSRPMTGNLNMNANNIVGAQDITATRNVTAGEYRTPLVVEGAACTSNGAISSGDGVVMACNNGAWRVQAGYRANTGEACTTPGRFATDIASSVQLVCRTSASGTTYVPANVFMPNRVAKAQRLVTDQLSVPKPVCPNGGAAAYHLAMNQMAVDIGIAPPKQAMFVSASDAGSAWTVNIKLKDDGGNQHSGNAYGLSAVMTLECVYL